MPRFDTVRQMSVTYEDRLIPRFSLVAPYLVSRFSLCVGVCLCFTLSLCTRVRSDRAEDLGRLP